MSDVFQVMLGLVCSNVFDGCISTSFLRCLNVCLGLFPPVKAFLFLGLSVFVSIVLGSMFSPLNLFSLSRAVSLAVFGFAHMSDAVWFLCYFRFFRGRLQEHMMDSFYELFEALSANVLKMSS